ncbi:uncharacterized protein LOC111347452 [Stylophora pistillata]|uniref:uncharacterized protein LOC111347452 n=1 Tax=Stylophora pistillata TaxID=50429 RepID=UPI000C044D08|nr:uncharacterized protein LOC111347452 [Stylophora pistillata]
MEINRYLEILLESGLNSGNRYQTFRDKEDKTKKTLLHYAVELGFLHVTKTLVKKCPLLLGQKTVEQLEPEQRAMLPVELAMLAANDEVAAYLVRIMWHERVKSLFSWIPDDMTEPQLSVFSFKSVIENPKMKKTVVAILDQMVNPYSSHLPKCKDTYDNEEEKEATEGVWRTITDDPLNYHFYYHILDSDEGGCPPNLLYQGKHMDNKFFNWRDQSCLHVIATSTNMEALQHPVVRMLIKRKWQSYGHWFLSLQAVFYVIFLLLLTYSLLHASTKPDPNSYRSVADSLRGFCEVATLCMTGFYIYEEINQIRM